MGSSFKKAIFEEHVQESLVGWAQKVKRRKAFRAGSNEGSVSSSVEIKDRPSVEIQTQKLLDTQKDSLMEEGKAGGLLELNGITKDAS